MPSRRWSQNSPSPPGARHGGRSECPGGQAMTPFSRTQRGLLGRWWWTVDRPLLAGFGLLAVSGLVFVFASSPPVAARLGLPPLYFVGRHAMYLLPATLLLLGSSLLSPKGVHRLAVGLLVLTLVLLVLTLLFGPEIKGARRWLPIGGLVVQPGEFMKPALVIVVAGLLAKADGLRNALPGLLLAALALVLLLSQPDVSMALMVACLVGLQLFLAGLPWLLVIGLVATGGLGLWQTYLFFPHVTQRFDRFFDPSVGDHFQVGLALEAVQGANWFGSGPGEGTVKYALARRPQRLRVRGDRRGVRAGRLPRPARPVRLRPAARPAADRAGRRPLRPARGGRPARAFRSPDDHQRRRQSEARSGDRHDPALHQLRRLLALRAGARDGHVPGPDPAPAGRRERDPAAAGYRGAVPAAPGQRALSRRQRRAEVSVMTRGVVIGAGGTGGHMFPALALARELQARGQEVLLVCDARGARYVGPDLVPHLIRAGSPSGRPLRRLQGFARLGAGLVQALALLRRRRPAAVAAFGGYASVPVGLAARLLGIPLLIHEQNAVLGRANRLIARKARCSR